MSLLARTAGLAGAGLAARAAWRRASAIDLEGKTALVTGGSRGLGFALANELAGQGARVVICGRDEGHLERARGLLAARGADVRAFTCDVARHGDVQRMVEEVGRIDVLVNNAGVIAVGALASQRHDDFKEMLDIMLWGVINPTLAVLPQMVERRDGRIANITSIGGKVSVPLLLPYDTAKFAAVGFSEGLRAEVARHGVTVTTVVPGLMRTGSYLHAQFKGDTEYALFAPLASLPLVTIHPARAARRIVAAIRRGDPEITLTPLAKAAARANGVAPGLVADTLAFVNRFLPESTEPEKRAGKDIESRVDDSFLVAPGRKAAADYNQ
jgi:NAD(P)-dependent dehydrogenase (short-subunit alcohol dehydrogenase family)